MFQELEKSLPPRPPQPTLPQHNTDGDEVEEVDMVDVQDAGSSSDAGQRSAYDYGSDDERQQGAPRVQCAHQ